MIRPILLLFIFLALPFLSWAQVIHYQMTRDEVIAILGKPDSQLELGNEEFLLYPKGVKVELVNGYVKRAEGVEFSFYPQEGATNKLKTKSAALSPKPIAPATSPNLEEKESSLVGEDETGPVLPSEFNYEYEINDMHNMSEEEAQAHFRQLMSDEMGLTETEADYMFGPSYQSEEEEEAGLIVMASATFVMNLIAMFVIVLIAYKIAGFTLLSSEGFLVAFLYALLQLAFVLVDWGADVRGLFKLDEGISFVVLTLLLFHCTPVTQGIMALKLAVGCFVVSYVLDYVLFFLILMLIGMFLG